jgi:hypothetical protein
MKIERHQGQQIKKSLHLIKMKLIGVINRTHKNRDIIEAKRNKNIFKQSNTTTSRPRTITTKRIKTVKDNKLIGMPRLKSH